MFLVDRGLQAKLSGEKVGCLWGPSDLARLGLTIREDTEGLMVGSHGMFPPRVTVQFIPGPPLAQLSLQRLQDAPCWNPGIRVPR